MAGRALQLHTSRRTLRGTTTAVRTNVSYRHCAHSYALLTPHIQIHAAEGRTWFAARLLWTGIHHHPPRSSERPPHSRTVNAVSAARGFVPAKAESGFSAAHRRSCIAICDYSIIALFEYCLNYLCTALWRYAVGTPESRCIFWLFHSSIQ